MTTLTAKEVFAKIEKQAKTSPADTRVIRAIAVDEFIRQGDIYLTRIADDAPLPKDLSKTRQLAPGNTKGSRHIVEGEVTIYERKSGTVLDGPIVDAPNGFTLTHPEHANFVMPPGRYSATYQRDHEKEEIARVMD
jgi:hypothetical protein